MYEVMICDIKNSRELENREEIQGILLKTIDKCNKKFINYIISPFRITAGDEWEGLLKIDSPIIEIIDFFNKNLPNNINFYTGIGIGDISIKDVNLPVNALDGPVFYEARSAIKYAKRKKLSIVLFKKQE